MHTVFYDIALVVLVTALLSGLAVSARQPIILAYIAAGVLIGPSGLGWISNLAFLNEAGHIGVTLLLFLAGIELQPRKFIASLKRLSVLTFGSSLIFAACTTGLLRLLGFSPMESLIGGLAMMFSSTILVIKLLPTLTLHHKNMGAICIGILILQDLLAMAVLILIRSWMATGHIPQPFLWRPLGGLLLVVAAFAGERLLLRRWLHALEHYHETLYLLSLGWCLGFSLLAAQVGLSHEVGAFIAGLALAQNPMNAFLFEGLKFFRDFFLVLLFFVLGAQLDWGVARDIWLQVLLLSAVVLLLKPLVYQRLLSWIGETGPLRETAMRLGQCSEFGLIIALVAAEGLLISARASQLIQFAVLLTMMVSSTLVTHFYPSPLAMRRDLKQD